MKYYTRVKYVEKVPFKFTAEKVLWEFVPYRQFVYFSDGLKFNVNAFAFWNYLFIVKCQIMA